MSKVALITGGASGLGRALALRFSELGYRIVIGDLPGPKGDAVVNEIRKQDREAIFVACDVRKSDELRRLFDTGIATYRRLDVVCNNAGPDRLSYFPFSAVIFLLRCVVTFA